MKLTKRLTTIVCIVALILSNTISCSAKTVSGLPSFTRKAIVNSPTKTPRLSLDFEIKNSNPLDTAPNAQSNNGSIQLEQMTGGVYSYSTVELTPEERRYIANTIMHEVGSYPDPLTGIKEDCPKMNVACVILNRYVSGYWEFPTTIQGIITQSGAFSGISTYWNRTDYATNECYDAIDAVLQTGDITGESWWFRNPSITGYNSFFDGNTITYMYGDYAGHAFYKIK